MGGKIDVKNDAETERLENSILIDFGSIWEPSWPSKTEPRRSKIDVEMASKFDQFLKASWNAIFSAQEAPRRASAADRRRRWSRPEATGGGFRRGKQEPPRRRIRKEDGRKDSETWYSRLTRRPRWAADRRLRLCTAAPVYQDFIRISLASVVHVGVLRRLGCVLGCFGGT